ncbi:hypothetical protein BC830DRAFT_1121159, partial [Chytriomyces sp. MP71]
LPFFFNLNFPSCYLSFTFLFSMAFSCLEGVTVPCSGCGASTWIPCAPMVSSYYPTRLHIVCWHHNVSLTTSQTR